MSFFVRQSSFRRVSRLLTLDPCHQQLVNVWKSKRDRGARAKNSRACHTTSTDPFLLDCIYFLRHVLTTVVHLVGDYPIDSYHVVMPSSTLRLPSPSRMRYWRLVNMNKYFGLFKQLFRCDLLLQVQQHTIDRFGVRHLGTSKCTLVQRSSEAVPQPGKAFFWIRFKEVPTIHFFIGDPLYNPCTGAIGTIRLT
jgi:hypothetical protein